MECILELEKRKFIVSNVRTNGRQNAGETGERLLNALAEQMKLPLLQIARRAELARGNNDTALALETIELTADNALKLLDFYLLSTKLARAQPYLQLEPVSLSAVLSDSAHELAWLAKRYNCELELHLSGKYEPVMAHKAGLEAALISLGYVFIEAQSGQNTGQRSLIKLAAHRSHGGIVAGMFANLEGLGSSMYKKAHELYGHARQPLIQLTSSTGTGVFVADSLLSSMSAHMHVARHQKLTGLAATFPPSRQTSLV